MLKINYLEEGFKVPSYFSNELIFDATYMPVKLLHRENELILISRFFLPILKKPYEISKKIIIVGKIGVGKTITAHNFGKMIIESATRRKINLKFLHLNCRNIKSDYLILKTILDSLVGNVPSRGLSIGELNQILIDYLSENLCHIIIVFDELDYLLNRNSDIIYSFTRLNEVGRNFKFGLSIIGILKNKMDLNHLDTASLSSLQNNVISFKKYSLDQTYDILKQRADLGISKGVISEDMLKMIAEMTVNSGDMRLAINLLKNSVIYCENHGLKYVTPEAIRNANSEYTSLGGDDLKYLNFHELILLKATCNLLIAQKSRNVALNIVKEEYSSLCEQYKKNPRSNTQIWEYIQNLKNRDFFDAIVKNKNIKGRKTYIGINQYSVNKIVRGIDSILNEMVLVSNNEG